MSRACLRTTWAPERAGRPKCCAAGRPGKAPRPVCPGACKLPGQSARTRRIGWSTRLYKRECDFYRHTAPEAPLRSPRPLYGCYDPHIDDCVAVLEDLAGMVSEDILAGAGPGRTEATPQSIAALHERCWNRVHEPPLSNASEFIGTRIGVLSQLACLTAMRRALGRFGKAFSSVARRPARGVGPRAADVLRHLFCGRGSFIHESNHLHNLLFGPGSGEDAAIDWQTSSPDNPPLARETVLKTRNCDTAGAFVAPPRRQALWAFAATVMAVFLTALGQTVVLTALPRIAADLGRFDQYAWTVTAYAVAVTIVIPIAGGLSDRYGRRTFLLLGVAILAIASLSAGWSPDMAWMAASRAVQGVGGGIVSAVAVAAVADLFAPEERGKQIGLISAAYGLAFLVGPPLGGLLTDVFSWRWTLWLNVPLGALIMLPIARMYPRTGAEAGRKRLDLAGMSTLVLSAGPILLALSWGGVIYPWTSPVTIGFLAFGAAMAAVFLFVERRAAAPIMPPGVYRLRPMAVSIVVMLLTGLVLYGSLIALPLYFQGVTGLSAAASGTRLSVLLIGMAVGGVASGQLVSRTGGRYRLWGLAGTGMMAVGAFLMAGLHGESSAATAMASMCLTGVGFGFILSTFTLAVQNSTPPGLVGATTSALQFFGQLGGALVLAAIGPAVALRFASRAQQTVPDGLEARLRPGRLEALKHDPQALLDPSPADALRAAFEPPATAPPVDALLAALRAALGGAVGDVLLVLAIAASLSAAATLLLRVSAGDENRGRVAGQR